MDRNFPPDENGRIKSDPAVCHGTPVVRGTRIMVWLVLAYLAEGETVDGVLAAYPALTHEDIQACLAFAARAARERIVPVEMGSHAV